MDHYQVSDQTCTQSCNIYTCIFVAFFASNNKHLVHLFSNASIFLLWQMIEIRDSESRTKIGAKFKQSRPGVTFCGWEKGIFAFWDRFQSYLKSCLLILTSSTIDIFFKITKFSKILSKFDKFFENFRKKCQFRMYFRKFCNFEKSATVNEVNIIAKVTWYRRVWKRK